MQRFSFLGPLALCLMLIGGCAQNTNLGGSGANPLALSRYGDELADTMANLIIADDPAAQDEEMRAIINAEIERGKAMGNDARAVMDAGMKGALIPVKEEMQGYALYVNDTLFLSTDFYTKPGPDLRVYMTTVVDPRDVAFPDDTAIDLGAIASIYGAQQYRMPHQKNPELYRTLTLYDRSLKRIYGFAQLSK